jgi:hypothetical protein
MTLARGSGENIRFSDKEVPLPQSADPKSRNWKKQWTLAELGMEPGDELYFFVRATDNAPSPHTAQSPTYTLRLPGPDAESLDSTALPTVTKPENLRSQRQIILDTEQLVADLKAHPDMPRPPCATAAKSSPPTRPSCACATASSSARNPACSAKTSTKNITRRRRRGPAANSRS